MDVMLGGSWGRDRPIILGLGFIVLTILVVIT